MLDTTSVPGVHLEVILIALDDVEGFADGEAPSIPLPRTEGAIALPCPLDLSGQIKFKDKGTAVTITAICLEFLLLGSSHGDHVSFRLWILRMSESGAGG